jgi:hypothetical protein
MRVALCLAAREFAAIFLMSFHIAHNNLQSVDDMSSV